MTALVRETIGFSQDRGDSVNLMNAPFVIDTPLVVEIPLWRQPELIDLARSMAWPFGTLLLAALVLLGFVRPALKTLAKPVELLPAAANQIDAIEGDEPERPLLAAPSASNEVSGPTPAELALEDARKLTRDNPEAVANIVKSWMNNEAPA